MSEIAISTSPAPAATRSRKPLVLALLGIAGAAAICGATYWWLDARNYESTDDAFIATHIVHVSPQIAGRVARVLVDDNQVVEAGQTLMEIDPADAQSRLDQTLANLGSAQGKLAQAQAQAQVAQATLDEFHAQIGSAQANAASTSSDFKRYETLSKTGVTSIQQLDNARALALSSNANLTAASKKIITGEAQVQLSQSQVKTAQADVAAMQSQVDQAKLALSYTKVIATEAGRVTQRAVTAGDFVQMGQDLMALVPAQVWVTANFKETQLTHLRVGQDVGIAIDAYPGEKFTGRVASMQAGSGSAFALLPAENATGNYVKVVQRVPVKINFDAPFDAAHVIGPGMSVVPSVRIR